MMIWKEIRSIVKLKAILGKEKYRYIKQFLLSTVIFLKWS